MFRRGELRHVAKAVDRLEIEPADPVAHRFAVDGHADDAVGAAEQDAGRHINLAVTLLDAAEILFDRDDIGRSRMEMRRPQPQPPPPATM